MSYLTELARSFGKSGIWLYEFTRDGVTTRLCAAGSDYVDGSAVTWTAAPVTHTRFRITSAIGREETQLVFPQSNAFARGYLTDLSYSENSVTIYHEFRDQTPEARAVKFRGRVTGTQPRFTRLTLVAQNRFTELGRKGLSAVMQRPCRHALYHEKDGYGCGLAIADFEEAGTATAFAANVATVTGADAQADGYYSGGVLTWSGKRQMIVRHVGTALTLLGPIDGLAAAIASSSSEAVTIGPGCDLTRATCEARFDNLANFGGFPWMTDSPFDGRTLF